MEIEKIKTDLLVLQHLSGAGTSSKFADLALVCQGITEIVDLISKNSDPATFAPIKSRLSSLQSMSGAGTTSRFADLAIASQIIVDLAEYLNSSKEDLLTRITSNTGALNAMSGAGTSSRWHDMRVLCQGLVNLSAYLTEKKSLRSGYAAVPRAAAGGAGAASIVADGDLGTSPIRPSLASPALFSKPKTDKWTIVRVWLPRDSEGNFVTAHETAASQRPGHVSLQTSEIYASFWPDWELARKGRAVGAILGEARGALVPNPDKDEYLESEQKTEQDRKPPDVIVVLYSLNVDAINEAFRSFSKSSVLQNWSLFGRNLFNVFNRDAGQSCSGLVYDLLNAGGIQSIVKWDIVSKTWVVAPDAVARVAVMAAETPGEIALAKKLALPDGIKDVITRPDHSLDPHTWGIGSWLGNPGKK